MLLLAAYWFSGLFWATVLFRLLGVWCHRSRSATLGQADKPLGTQARSAGEGRI